MPLLPLFTWSRPTLSTAVTAFFALANFADFSPRLALFSAQIYSTIVAESGRRVIFRGTVENVRYFEKTPGVGSTQVVAVGGTKND